MYFRKYLAFVETTCPWIFCCFLAWWSDRLFVEFGHRTTDSPTCTHSDLQYVHWHQAMTGCAVFAQIIHSARQRHAQFRRELSLVASVTDEPCLLHLLVVQIVLCVSWAGIIACLVDVSPWLCVPSILQYRASISLGCLGLVFSSLVMERKLWGRTLDNVARIDATSFEI